jgi:hypothetical protein
MGDKWRVEEITLLPKFYRYHGYGKPQLILVDKDYQHPDPYKKLMWGRNIRGEVVPGDFKGCFDKAGKPIKFKVRISTYRATATQEKEQRIKAIKEFIRDYPWEKFYAPEVL